MRFGPQLTVSRRLVTFRDSSGFAVLFSQSSGVFSVGPFWKERLLPTLRLSWEEYMSQGEPLHCVFLMNDDFTPMEFVVHVLERFFDMDPETAKRTMLRIHNEGAGECGFYPRQEAEQKVAEVVAFAERHGHPLQCACETRREISE